MTFNDFWHISEMVGNVKVCFALQAVARSARYIMGGIYPHSACRFGHLRGVNIVSHFVRCRFATMCRSLSELHDLPLQWRATKESIQEEINGGRVALQCDCGIKDAEYQKLILERATIMSMTCLRVAQTVALESDPPMPFQIFLIFPSFSFQPIALHTLQIYCQKSKS